MGIVKVAFIYTAIYPEIWGKNTNMQNTASPFRSTVGDSRTLCRHRCLWLACAERCV